MIDGAAHRRVLALRLLAGARLAAITISVIGVLVTRWLMSRAWTGAGAGVSALTERYLLVSHIQQWAFMGTVALAAAALLIMFVGLPHGRAAALATAALVAAAVELAALAFDLATTATPLTRHALPRQVLWAVRTTLDYAWGLLALAAASRGMGVRLRDSFAALTFIALAGAVTVFAVVTAFAPAIGGRSAALGYTRLAAFIISSAAFAVAALQQARRLARGAVAREAGEPVSVPGGADPHAFRLLGWANVVRASIGIPLAGAAMWAAASRAYDAGQVALIGGTLASVAVAAMMVTSMRAQLRMPAALRDGDALAFAIVLACISALLDIAAAVVTIELLSGASAASSGSFWSGPSLSTLQDLQTMSTWLGRGAQLVGFAAGLAILRSLAATARGLDSAPLVRLAKRVTLLLIATGVAAAAIGIWVASIPRSHLTAEVLLGAGGVILVAGVITFAQLLQLCFGLARAAAPKTSAS
jgi:hypothetical protein